MGAGLGVGRGKRPRAKSIRYQPVVRSPESQCFDRLGFDRLGFDRLAFDRLAFDRLAFDRLL
jgi:hypothetical protein